MPFLKNPGYGKVQVGIYITALEDALRRIVLDNVDGGQVGVTGKSPSPHAANSRRTGRGRKRAKKRTRTADWGARTLDWEVRYHPYFANHTD